MSLFTGYSKAYGSYSGKLSETDGKKMKGKATTLAAPVTVELFNSHVTGKQGLGIIPVRETGEVMFAAIDIDEYPLDLLALNRRIQEHKLPLVLCRTKSGGAHLYLFMRDWTDAKIVQKKLRNFASMLGHGSAEIFPKQAIIISDRGDVGSWINLPYFNSAKTDRYALNDKCSMLDVSDFIDYANSKKVTLEELHGAKDELLEVLPGGPPCLNHLASLGFPEGTRNNGLFNLGVYAMKVFPEGWREKLEEYNNKFMDPPLPAQEVLGVIKSLTKKEFTYTCKNPPISQYCNMPKCRTCKHGIGKMGAGLPTFGSLTKLATDPPLWFLEIEDGGRLELSTEELQNQLAFQRRCLAALNIMPSKIKQDLWEEIIQNLLSTMTVIEVPIEATPIGQLHQHLMDFCTSRAQARSPDEILLGKPWTNNGYHYFRIQDFFDYLTRRRFDALEQHYVMGYIKTLRMERRFFNIKGRGINTIAMPEFTNKQTEPFEAHEEKRETPY